MLKSMLNLSCGVRQVGTGATAACPVELARPHILSVTGLPPSNLDVNANWVTSLPKAPDLTGHRVGHTTPEAHR